jgi:hypothetical protein
LDEYDAENSGVNQGDDWRGTANYILQAHFDGGAASVGLSDSPGLQDQTSDTARRAEDAGDAENAFSA